MSTVAKTRTYSVIFALLLLCSCTTTPHSPAVPSECDLLPDEVSINEDAGRGNPIFVTLRLASGEELPLEVDTGAPYTLFDKSLEPKLGKRVGSITTSFCGVKRSGGLYIAPQLYLGNTPLRTEWIERIHTNVVATAELQELASKLGHPMMGILGMDCLQYYCIQIDFQGAKLRFLNPARLKAAGLGKRFALTYDTNGCPRLSHGALVGRKDDYAIVDTGYYPGDGALELRLLQEARQQEFGPETRTVQFCGTGLTCFPGCVWSGRTYTNLLIGEEGNFIGLRFLARHLVTLDFRNHKMYLRRTTSGPPAGDWYLKFRAGYDSALAFLGGSIKRGQLPGGSTNGNCDWQDESNSGTFHFSKEDGSSVYHYKVIRAPQDSGWKVQRAWRTDQDGHTIEEYPAP